MNPFIGEIRIYGFNFAPKGWALCNGQLMAIAQNTALFSILGTTYGGNGQTTFGLPNLQDSVPIHAGQGPNTSDYSLGQVGGEPTVTLNQQELPAHTHPVNALNGFPANLSAPDPQAGMSKSSQGNAWLNPPSSPVPMSMSIVGLQGGDQPHNNMMPYLTLNFCIALQGIFPPRS